MTIAPTHDILRLKKNVTKIDFGADKINRLENKVKGKWKKVRVNLGFPQV